MTFFTKNLKNGTSKIFGGPGALGENGKNQKKVYFGETQKSEFLMVLESHTWNLSEIGDNFFFSFPKGGPFGVL